MFTSRTQRPLFDAIQIIDRLKKAGVPWPKDLSQSDFFGIVCSRWTAGNKDFSELIVDSKGPRFFKEFADAKKFFAQSGYQDFMEKGGSEIEVMLIQYNRGNGKVMHSKILFPS